MRVDAATDEASRPERTKRKGRGTQQQGIDDAEYRRIGANSKREYEDGQRGVPRVPRNAANRVMNVVTERLQSHGILDGPHVGGLSRQRSFRVVAGPRGRQVRWHPGDF